MRPAVLLCAALAVSAAIAQAQIPSARVLKRDPFDWTALQQAARKSAPEPVATAVKPEVPPRVPRLRAVMRGSSGDRVNLDGVILAIGESADGYKLVEVREYSAVFSRKGIPVEIELTREQTP